MSAQSCIIPLKSKKKHWFVSRALEFHYGKNEICWLFNLRFFQETYRWNFLRSSKTNLTKMANIRTRNPQILPRFHRIRASSVIEFISRTTLVTRIMKRWAVVLDYCQMLLLRPQRGPRRATLRRLDRLGTTNILVAELFTTIAATVRLGDTSSA